MLVFLLFNNIQDTKAKWSDSNLKFQETLSYLLKHMEIYCLMRRFIEIFSGLGSRKITKKRFNFQDIFNFKK